MRKKGGRAEIHADEIAVTIPTAMVSKHLVT